MEYVNAFRKYGQYVVLGLILFNLLFALAAIFGAFQPEIVTPPSISHPVPGVKTIRIPEAIITEKVVTRYVPTEDRAQVSALLRENRKLKIEVDQLSWSLAQSDSRGTGTVTWNIPVDTTLDAPPTVSFKDWRLSFESVGTRASYSLSQQFAIVNTVGRTKQNVATNLIRLYEIGPNNERTLIPVTDTTTVVTTPAGEGWYVKPTLQGGWGAIVTIPTVPGAKATASTAGVIALPWLKHGKSRSVENTRWAFLTPAATINNSTRGIGILPVSLNIGTCRNQPFTNVWLSPYLGLSTGTNPTQTGFVVSFTF